MEAFGQNARDRRAVGLAGVAALHVLVVYALVTGLGKDLVKVIQQKVEVAVISEPPPPPPPPPPKIEKVVKDTAPPPPQQQPAYVPPPVVAPTTQSTNTIQATSEAKAPSAPAVPQATAAPVAAPAGPISAIGNCSKLGKPEYPRKADADGIGGVVTVWFKVNAEGKLSDITNIKYASSIPMGYRNQFQASIRQALKEHVCKAASGEATLEQEFGFTASAEE
ncbi:MULTISPECIES: hypothetical protein [Iodobacter]|uniref:Protein TonB n=1 Tax=Iodobacter fluviatilis TaxID=537 RepID=A0A377Q781_9NEIS|nr:MULTISPECIES: hypothetical protein [Iodobacter]TCU89236.1 outer membrane transport energization protein TonB [Iodobacter fluviatilis]STQ90605.1 transport protein TonB [Iodobacter fluviatilis]